ncbi:hypothetical protein [Sandaracinus amylolyticus]|uniref:hypothetical protein n=1 Tax=Sandaracinus amylolyticus TaxID=927083 RepID=UPI001F474B79|nr:hypothetical protein [Sandaracinus amylolyticus]
MVVFALVGTPFVLACRDVDSTSGTSIGSFEVHGTLDENGCAPGLDTIDPLEFRVDLARDHDTLTWRMQGGGPVFGTIEDDGEFRVRSSSETEAWPEDPVNGIRGCRLTQVETVEGTIRDLPPASDGGVPDAGTQGDGGAGARPSFEASHRIEVLPVVGSDCSPLLIVHGGSFPTLPCSALYELEADAD